MRRGILLAALAAISVSVPTAAAKSSEPIQMSATTDYAKTVSAVCTVMPLRNAAAGLVYFLNAAGVEKKPTVEATTAFCDGFKGAFPLSEAEARSVLTATADAGGAPSPQRKKKDKDKDPPPPSGGGGGGGGNKYFHLKIKLFGQEFEIEIGQKNPPATEPAGGEGGGSGGGSGGTPDSNPPPYNPGRPPQD